jgi:hypothetical protein
MLADPPKAGHAIGQDTDGAGGQLAAAMTLILSS